jgi:hypothetical protein
MGSVNRFFDEMKSLGAFLPSQKDRYLHDFATEYHRVTEAFDREVCRCRNERGIAIPADRDERRACSQNAADIEREIMDRIHQQGLPITRAELRRAIQDAAPR